jgi:transposase
VFGIGPATRIYLAVGATDMRKGFNGLHGLVRDRLALEPTSGHLFLFSPERGSWTARCSHRLDCRNLPTTQNLDSRLSLFDLAGLGGFPDQTNR